MVSTANINCDSSYWNMKSIKISRIFICEKQWKKLFTRNMTHLSYRLFIFLNFSFSYYTRFLCRCSKRKVFVYSKTTRWQSFYVTNLHGHSAQLENLLAKWISRSPWATAEFSVEGKKGLKVTFSPTWHMRYSQYEHLMESRDYSYSFFLSFLFFGIFSIYILLIWFHLFVLELCWVCVRNESKVQYQNINVSWTKKK